MREDDADLVVGDALAQREIDGLFVRRSHIARGGGDLLVHVGSSLGVALAQSLRKLKQNKRARHKNRRVLRQVTENFGGLGVLSSSFVNHSRLILRHRHELFVFARADLL